MSFTNEDLHIIINIFIFFESEDSWGIEDSFKKWFFSYLYIYKSLGMSVIFVSRNILGHFASSQVDFISHCL